MVSEEQIHKALMHIFAELANPASLADVLVSWVMSIYDRCVHVYACGGT